MFRVKKEVNLIKQNKREREVSKNLLGGGGEMALQITGTWPGSVKAQMCLETTDLSRASVSTMVWC